MALGVRIRYRSREGVSGERLLHHLPVRLGRNPMNECHLPHPFVSDFHAVIDLSGGELCIRDLNSRNGLFDRQGGRLPAGSWVSLRALGGAVILGMGVEVEVEPVEDDRDVGARSPSFVQGLVLGNAAAFGASNGVAPLPPLSMERPLASGSPPRPRYETPALGPESLGQSLPSLAPLAPLAHPAATPREARRPSPVPDDPNRGTQNLSMSMELLALMGLRELAASLVPGVPLETTGDVARLLTKIHDALEVFCRCIPSLRDTRLPAQRAGHRQPRSKSAKVIEMASDPAAIAAALLDWRDREYDAPDAAEHILADVVAQQAAVLDNVMAGVDALLSELSPERIEQVARQEGGLGAVLGPHRALWQAFEERFRQLGDPSRRAEIVLGPEVADAIRRRQARPRT
jgi:type VI secretion system protein ImpI